LPSLCGDRSLRDPARLQDCQFLQPEEVPLLLDVGAAFARHVPRVVTLDHVTAVPAASADPQVVAEAAHQQADREFEA